MQNEDGRVPTGQALVNDAPAGFDPSRAWDALTPALRRSFREVPGPHWLTAAELKPATGMALTLLVTKYGLLDRRWTRWGGELGQSYGEGYEYAMTERGLQLLGWLCDSDAGLAEDAGTAAEPRSGGSADPKGIAHAS